MGFFDIFKSKVSNSKNAAADAMEELYNDAEKYASYLEGVLAKIPEDKKNEIITLVRENKKIEAVSLCKNTTGEGLKVAKDLVEKYLV